MKKKFTAEMITDKQPTISHERAYGYGETAVATRIDSRVRQVTIAIDNIPALVIDIDDAGNVHLTNCLGMFEHLFGTSLRLKNTRPWKG